MKINKFLIELEEFLQKHDAFLNSYNIEMSIKSSCFDENTIISGKQEILMNMQIGINYLENDYGNITNTFLQTKKQTKENVKIDNEIILI